MNKPLNLPSKINTILVSANQIESGVLTHGSVHYRSVSI